MSGRGDKSDRDTLRERLLNQRCTLDEVAQEFRSRWRFTVLASYRYAADLSQSEAAAAYNRITEDASARMDASLLSKLEQWPARTGKAPTLYNLAVLAQVYGTTAERLVSVADIDQLPVRDRVALRLLTREPRRGPGRTPSRLPTGKARPFDSTADDPRGVEGRPSEQKIVFNEPVDAECSWLPNLVPAIEHLRCQMESALSQGTATPAWMEVLEESVLQHKRDYIKQPPAPMLTAGLVDFARIRSLLSQRQSTRIQQRLCACAAQLSTLAADALMKLGQIREARAWYRTAWMAADETDDLALRALVRAQATMLPYYYCDVSEAIRLAVEATELVSRRPCPASALAAAAEARAAARLGDPRRAERAMEAARDVFDKLDAPGPEDAFRFPRKRLLFYLSGALTFMDRPARAVRAHDEALEAYATDEGNFVIDPALIQLDNASTLGRSGLLDEACQISIDAITSLPDAHRTDILARRCWDVLQALPPPERRRTSATDLQSVLTSLPRSGSDALSSHALSHTRDVHPS